MKGSGPWYTKDNRSLTMNNPSFLSVRTLAGSREVRKSTCFACGLLLLLLIIICTSGVSASEVPPATYPADTGYPSPDGIVIYFFYNQHCGDCQKAISFIQDLHRQQPDVQIKAFDIFDNATNDALYQEMNERYGHPFSPVPSVFIGDRQIIGIESIETDLPGAIDASRANGTSILTPFPTPTGGNESPESPVSKLTLPLIISAALVDGINPCAFAVFVFLLVTIMTLESRKKMLLVGSVFIAAVFLFYFFSGLGIFAIVQVSGIARIFSLVAAGVAVIIGLVTIRDAFSGDEGAMLAIPGSRKATVEAYVRKGSLPAAFILGILVGMFELPCTGGIYLAILSLLSHQGTMTAGLPYLLIYNVFFIIPLILILVIVSFGLPPERLNSWRVEHRKVVRLCMGALMIGIGVFIIITAYFW
jgi:cytochrome c biogenesis protein CcdA/glutaredoxin